MKLEEIEGLVVKWASDRNIIHGSTKAKQTEKLAEELIELALAIGAGDTEEERDALGDMMVVITIICAQAGYSLKDAYLKAYNEIKDRKGVMLNGKFTKEVAGV